MNEDQCGVSDEMLVAYDDRYLPFDQQRSLDRHIEQCRACQSRLRESREVDELIRVTVPPLSTVDHWPAMRARLVSRRVHRAGPRLARNGVTAALVLAMILIALASLFGPWSGLPLLGEFVQFGAAPGNEQPTIRPAVPAPVATEAFRLGDGRSQAVSLEAIDISWSYQAQSTLPDQHITLTAVPGTTISLSNVGAITHHFAIDAFAIDVAIPPGESVTVAIPRDATSGEFEFYCNMPGHRQAGMVGTLIVE